ncbi:MAG: O-antigen ligase family protein [Cyclobacteriaceae bacterium]
MMQPSQYQSRVSAALYFTLVFAIMIKPSAVNAVLMLIIALWLYSRGYLSLPVLWKSNIVKYLAVFYLALAISALLSEDQHHGLQVLFRRIPIIIIPFILPLFLNQVKRKHIVGTWVITWFIASLFSLFSTCYVYGFDFQNIAYFSWVLPNTLGIDSNYYALFCSATLILLVDDYFGDRALTKSRMIYLSLGAYFFFFLALLSSRTTFFSTSLVLLCLPFFINNQLSRKAIVFSLTSGVVIISLLFFSIPYLREKTFLVLSENDARYYEFQAGWEVIKGAPLFGVGLGDTSKHLMEQYQTIGFDEGIKNEYNVHNEFLHVAMSAGILTLLVFLLPLTYCVREAVRSKSFAQFGFILVFVLACFTEVVLNRFNGIMFFSILLTTLFIKPFYEKHSSR